MATDAFLTASSNMEPQMEPQPCSSECGNDDERGGFQSPLLLTATRNIAGAEHDSALSDFAFAEGLENDVIFRPKEPLEAANALQSLYPRLSPSSPSIAIAGEGNTTAATSSAGRCLGFSPYSEPSTLKSASSPPLPYKPFLISDDARCLVTRGEVQDIHMQIAQAIEAITERVDLKVNRAMEAISRVKETSEKRLTAVEGYCRELQRDPHTQCVNTATEAVQDKAIGAAINAIAEAVELRCDQLRSDIESMRAQENRLVASTSRLEGAVDQISVQQTRFVEALEKHASFSDQIHGRFTNDIAELRQKCADTLGSSRGCSTSISNVHLSGSVTLSPPQNESTEVATPRIEEHRPCHPCHWAAGSLTKHPDAAGQLSRTQLACDGHLATFIERQNSAGNTGRPLSTERQSWATVVTQIGRDLSCERSPTVVATINRPVSPVRLVPTVPTPQMGFRELPAAAGARCNSGTTSAAAVLRTVGTRAIPIVQPPVRQISASAPRTALSPPGRGRPMNPTVLLPSHPGTPVALTRQPRGTCNTPSQPLPIRLTMRAQPVPAEMAQGACRRVVSPSVDSDLDDSTFTASI